MGRGVFGAEAAARRYFNKPAGQLNAWEAARLAVMLPAPRRYGSSPARPTWPGAPGPSSRMGAVAPALRGWRRRDRHCRDNTGMSSRHRPRPAGHRLRRHRRRRPAHGIRGQRHHPHQPGGRRAAARAAQVIFEGIGEVVQRYQPTVAVCEIVFVNVNPQATLILGQARGCCLTALVANGLPVAEYTALQLKKAVTGHGKAAKPQVQEMVRRLLDLPGLPGKGRRRRARAVHHARAGRRTTGPSPRSASCRPARTQPWDGRIY